MKTPWLDKADAKKRGFEPFFGPVGPQEQWMLDGVLADGERQRVEMVLVSTLAQRNRVLWIYSKRFDAKGRKRICNQSN